MTTTNISKLVAAALTVALVGCGTNATPRPDTSGVRTQAPYNDTPQVTKVTGAVMDPDSYIFSLATCGEGCPFAPAIVPMTGNYDRSLVIGSTVELLDPATGVVSGQSATTGEDGAYTLPAVPSRAAPYFLQTSGGTLASPMIPPEIMVPPVPQPTKYYKTQTVTPMSTLSSGLCAAQVGWALSDIGVMQAVAKGLTAVTGSTFTVDDLVDPTKFHAVVYVQSLAPFYPSPALPALETSVKSDKGQVFHVQFAPPETDGIKEIQSALGFFLTEDPVSFPGSAVILFPASDPAPGEITVSAVDPKDAKEEGRPYRGSSFTFSPKSGVFTYLQLPYMYRGQVNGDALNPVLDTYPEWFCPAKVTLAP